MKGASKVTVQGNRLLFGGLQKGRAMIHGAGASERGRA